jgi:hypothetical protein
VIVARLAAEFIAVGGARSTIWWPQKPWHINASLKKILANLKRHLNKIIGLTKFCSRNVR